MFFADFKNAVIPQRVGEILRPTPEMEVRDDYVPFLLYKPLNKESRNYPAIYPVGYIFKLYPKIILKSRFYLMV